jgi:DNA-binding response OmpR family regulator
VLVVDEISDTAEVLQAVFEPRGVAVNRVRRLVMPTTAADRPSVIVLDAESLDRAEPAADQTWSAVPQVIIGTIRPVSTSEAAEGTEMPGRRYLQKPFQFAELMRAIESLISPEQRPAG